MIMKKQNIHSFWIKAVIIDIKYILVITSETLH